MKQINVQLSEFSRHEEPFRHYSEHGLDTYIIRYQVEGICHALIDGELCEIRPGDLLLFKKGELYDLRIEFNHPSVKRVRDYFVLSTGKDMDLWWNKQTRPTLVKIADDSRLTSIWNQIVLEKRRIDGGEKELLAALVWSLLLIIDRAIEEAPEDQSPLAYHALRMRQYIEDHSAETLTLQQVAEHCGLSISRAVYLFKAYFDISIIGYAQEVRLSHAIKLLDHSPMSLEQIATECGLGSYSYFHRLFRARYGISPGAYRKKK